LIPPLASRYTSFARAAEELHLTQPAVSMQIHQLEEAVGLRLFERIARKLTMTEAGEKLSHHASRILGEIKDAEDAMTSLKQADSGSIAVGIVSSATYIAPKLLAMYSHLYPKVDVHFSVGNRDALLRLLQDNAIDLAIMGRPPPEPATPARFPVAGCRAQPGSAAARRRAVLRVLRGCAGRCAWTTRSACRFRYRSPLR